MKTLLILAISALFSCSKPDCSETKQDSTSIVVKFISANKIPVVEGTINGKRAYFIVDSGASLSVLDINQDRKYSFDSYPINEEAEGYGGAARFYEVQAVDIRIGGKYLHARFRSQNLSNIVEIIRQHEGIYVSGILGSDVWKDLDAVIDYKSRTIAIR